MTAETGILGFADRYARFRASLEDDPGAQSGRALAAAFLVLVDQLLNGREPAGAVSDAIAAHDETRGAEYLEEEQAAARVLRFGCPACSAQPGIPCRHPDGSPGRRSHKRRRGLAARRRPPAAGP
jgi:hypothetical protein